MSEFDQRPHAGWKIWPQVSPDDPDPPRDASSRQTRELDQITGTGPRKTRRLPVKLLTRLLLQAHQRGSCWLDDFADDLVVIDADLHDVLLAFDKLQHEHRSATAPSANRAAA